METKQEGKPVNIGTAAKLSGVSAKTIRYYESVGLMPEPLRAANGYRHYRERDLQTLRFIHRSRKLGFTIKDIRDLLGLWQDTERASAGVREVAVRVFDRPVRLGRPRRVPHLADAASGPAFCAAAGVLQRAAFGPREAVSAKALASAKLRREPLDPRANPVAKAAAWLRENL